MQGTINVVLPLSAFLEIGSLGLTQQALRRQKLAPQRDAVGFTIAFVSCGNISWREKPAVTD